MNHLPPDVGDGSVCASFTADGSWLSVGTTDPDLGFVELTGMPPFRDTDRGDVAAVRAYRLLMEDVSTAFLRVRGAAPVRREASGGAVTQAYAVSGADPVVVEFAGHLDRPAYAEVTDVSPLPAIDLDSRASVDGHRLRVRTTVGVGASHRRRTRRSRCPVGRHVTEHGDDRIGWRSRTVASPSRSRSAATPPSPRRLRCRRGISSTMSRRAG